MTSSSSSLETFQHQKVIPNLDGLRGLSIFLVMLHHIPVVQGKFLTNLQENGRLGVMLFFVISGFLITYLALKERRETGLFSIRDFYVRRSLRIFPLYYAVLAFVCFLVYGLNVYSAPVKAEFSEKLPSYVFYYSNLIEPIGGPFSLLWSLAVEEQFYLFFALAFYFLPVRFSRTLFWCLAVLRLFMPVWSPLIHNEHIMLIAFRYQEAILLGVSLAYLFESPKFFFFISHYLGTRTILSVFFAALGGLFIAYSSQTYDWMTTVVNLLFMGIVCIASVMSKQPLLGGRLLSYVGKISYGIYLFHTIVFFAVKRFISPDPAIVFCLGVPLTIGVSTLSYEYFETYFLKLKKKFDP